MNIETYLNFQKKVTVNFIYDDYIRKLYLKMKFPDQSGRPMRVCYLTFDE
jgi:hypothetical protein